MKNSFAGQQSSVFAAAFQWWRNWTRNRASLAELRNLSPLELQGVAREVGVNPQELRVMAGKWPDSTDLLSRRVAELDLDAKEIARSQAWVSNDLRKLCSLCPSKVRCEHDLAGDTTNPAWQDYCPNATTLIALTTQYSAQAMNSNER